MGSRIELQTLLETVLGSRNVYFQPPENLKIEYPAIVYCLGGLHVKHADNQKYLIGKNYTLTLILDDPDSELVEQLLGLQYCSFDRQYMADNLYHYVFEIFY